MSSVGYFFIRELLMRKVYILKSINYNWFYVWMTSDFDRRISDHNKWYNHTTKHYAPFQVVYTEDCLNSRQARIREKYRKSWSWKKKIKEFVVGPDK